MKWNCNIVKEIYDRVLQRKFGILCHDDSSNEDIINSYLNRLDCEVTDLSCLNGDNQPCETATIIQCNIEVSIELEVNQVENVVRYTFTLTFSGDTPTNTFLWGFNSDDWNYISGQGTNILILEPSNQSGTEITTDVSILLTDSKQCVGENTIQVIYKGGCNDMNALNYDPNATFNNNTCYNEALTISSSYVCNEDNSGKVTIAVSGGLPPYTIVGTQDGAIIPNGGTYSSYAIDSLGNISSIVFGTIVCPFDCESVTINPNLTYECIENEFGNTGQANLYISPTGGTAPYIITGTINSIPTPIVNGMIVNDGDIVDITITDDNGCFAEVGFEVDCEPFQPPIPIDCGDIHFDFTTQIREQTQVGDKLGTRLYWLLNNLTPGVGFVDIEFTSVQDVGAFSSNFNCSPGTPPCTLTTTNVTGIELYEYDFTSNPPACIDKTFSIKVDAIITLLVAGGECQFEYTFTHNGNLECPFVAGTIISSNTQNY